MNNWRERDRKERARQELYYAEERADLDRRIQEKALRTPALQRQLARSAPLQSPGWSSLFPSGHQVRESDVRLERGIEEIRSQVGLLSEAVNQIGGDVRVNHEANLDRLDGLRAQITRENEKLMRVIRSIRERSNCDLRNPTTYIYCIELIYKLIFKIFVFLCQLVFVVGNSLKGFLSHMPFPFSLLVFIAYIFEGLLIFLIFDGTMFVSTVGVSHISFIPHNALYPRYSGVPQNISIRGALYEGLVVSILTVASQMFYLLGEMYKIFLGDTMTMIRGVTGRYISSETVVESIKEHIVAPVAEKASEKAAEMANEVANEQLSRMGSIPSELGSMALEGAGAIKSGAGKLAGVVGEGAGKMAGVLGEGAGKLAGVVGERTGAVRDRLRQIDSEDVKASARAAKNAAQSMAESIYHRAKRSGYFGGSTLGKYKRKSKHKMTLKKENKIIFSILTKNEQKEFDRTVAGQKIKKLEKIINNIDYSKIQPNPENFYMIRFVLNIAEKLFPVFVKELDRTTKVCKIMKSNGLEPVLNPYFLKQLSSIVSH